MTQLSNVKQNIRKHTYKLYMLKRKQRQNNNTTLHPTTSLQYNCKSARKTHFVDINNKRYCTVTAKKPR